MLQLTQPSPSLDLPLSWEARGLYVHIPFCFHKCHYCDFYSITRQSPERMEAFVDRVLAEATLWVTPTIRPSPRTVFFGGGTPSLLPINCMRRLIAGLKNCFILSGVDEWTVECNPATVSGDYCRMLIDSGVTRLSFGAQSFRPGELKLLERDHDPDDVPRSLDFARSAGFTRLNLDLIFAIPGQTLEDWLGNLNCAIELNVPHLSCYALTYEPNTALTVRKRLGQFASVDEALELQMLRVTRTVLDQHGYRAYEISNFARTGEACRHNLQYWQGENYLGLGPSAASHVDGHRWKNRPHLREWETAVDTGDLPVVDYETLSPEHRARELAMLLLRLDAGLNFADFSARTGYSPHALFNDQINSLMKLGLIHLDDEHIALTDKGLGVADAVAAEFL